ncbi:MAG: O-antigen ligase family protein [Pseudomonadota bacterium]
MYKTNFKLLASKTTFSAEQLFIISLVISPVFLLTVAGWMTRILAISALLATYLLYKNRNKNHESSMSNKAAHQIHLLVSTLALPLVAIFLAQSFRGQYAWAYYDSPIHILICALILLALLKAGARVVELMSYTFPIVTLLALGNILIHPNLFWGAGRLSTQAVDPLALGSLSLTFGLLSLISIKLHNHHSKVLVIYKLIGFGSGLYLSMASGSRTGWLALPIIGFLWLYNDRAKYTPLTKLAAALGVISVIILSYSYSATVHQRVDIATKEISSYQWNASSTAPNIDTSVGARISFARIAFFLLEKKPLSGWGDAGFESVINDPALSFAAISTQKLALTAGFHNEITANMVRSGIWGLISSVALFLIPALFFLRNMHSERQVQRNVAFLGLAFLICQFVSSLSMELLNLRYAASFYGLMLAVFCGQILFYTSHDTINTDGRTL